jgi:hypothetical protein
VNRHHVGIQSAGVHVTLASRPAGTNCDDIVEGSADVKPAVADLAVRMAREHPASL